MMKAVLFDFDGTLANTLPVCFYAFQSVFKEFDRRDVSAEEIVGMFGPSETGIIRENLLNEEKEKAIERYYEKYLEMHPELVEKNNEIDELIRLLKDRGLKLGIVTGKAKRSLEISLEALNMVGLFDVIITGDDVKKPKPHPEGVKKALFILGTENNEALFIGDSEADILAGVRANVYTIGVQWLPEYQTINFVTQPNQVMKNIKEFREFINRMNTRNLRFLI
ncbi:HAD family hydrolase [Metabacillus hrfriensis]|uniref:HAD family hydrolase n=2 Tax=Metabacillus TaxID=2675233 RepID=A0ACD4R680_9BACI|nr:HAD family hydrolase [Metabacillus sp. CT-WN-B3]WHZ55939.1 HAD family hydrolase [Metabacillus sp. CT-WN-B3]